MEWQAVDVQDRELLGKIEALTRSAHSHSSALPPSPTKHASVFDGQFEREAALEERVLYAVVDTNVLLSHLHYLQVLKAATSVKVVLVVPWVVVQELDGLKESSRFTSENDPVSELARRAIRVVRECIVKGDPHVRGQTLEDAHASVGKFHPESNDDRVLHCCLQMQARCGLAAKTVLVSNDHNLGLKAMINGVQAETSNSLAHTNEAVAALYRRARDVAPLPPHLAPQAPSSSAAAAAFSPAQQSVHPLLLSDTAARTEPLANPTFAEPPERLASQAGLVVELCNCSQWPGVHEMHGRDEVPPDVARRQAENTMDVD